MKHIIVATMIALLGLNASIAQDGAFTKKGDNDPKAKAILDKLKTKYDKYLALEVGVTLTIEIPEEDKETIEGKMVQSGDKYRIEMGDNIVICDGESLWTVMKGNQTVQLSDAEEQDDAEENPMMSPKDLMRMYEGGDYIYALTNEMLENGKAVQQIEFKPVDEDSEFFKMRLTVDKDKETISRIKVFSKDGSRFTLQINKMRTNKIYDSSYFQYDKSICPTCDVEDLRF